MRVFVAVELDSATVRAAAETARVLSRALDSKLRAAWVRPENMHLTVRFIGHVDDDRAAQLIEALSRPFDIAPFEVALGGCGVFPPSGPPRVIWIGLERGLPSLAAMHEECNRRVLPFGFEPEGRPFSAHLTLARVKDAPKGAGAAVREALPRAALQAPPTRVTRATIFQSHLSSKGPRYEPLGHAPVTGYQ